MELNSIRLSGHAHGIVTNTVDKTLSGGGGVGGGGQGGESGVGVVGLLYSLRVDTCQTSLNK